MHLPVALLYCSLAHAMLQLDIGRIVFGDEGTYIAGRETRKSTKLDPVVIGNDYYYYYATIGIGTPPQKLHVQIDTGSSDLWVMDSQNPYCGLSSGDQDFIDCTKNLIFNPGRSSTYHSADEPFSIDYADGTFAHGGLAKDTVSIAGQKLADSKFALASRANSAQIVMGIGFKANEAAGSKYDNIPLILKAKGIINVNSYSLWLNDIHAQSGAILFGAVDHSKYSGNLELVPLVSVDGGRQPDQMMISLSGISIGAQNVAGTELVNSNVPVLLDSGTSYTYLPEKIARVMADALGMSMDHRSGMYKGEFPPHKHGYFEFSFSGAKIRVPLDLLIDPADGDSSGREFQMLVLPVSDGANILGDSFLRAAYVVYDLDHYEVGLAQARYNVNTQSLEEIKTRIPGREAASYSENREQYVHVHHLRGPVNLVDTGSVAPSRHTYTTSSPKTSATVATAAATTSTHMSHSSHASHSRSMETSKPRQSHHSHTRKRAKTLSGAGKERGTATFEAVSVSESATTDCSSL